jgi:signal transduction histidine kinase
MQAPVMFQAFKAATTDDAVTTDQWGSSISGYAPIRKPGTQDAVAIIGIDMRADEYLFRLQSILPPLALLLLVMGAGILASYAAYMIASRKFEEWQMLDRERAGLMLLTFHQLGAPLTIFKWSLEALQMRSKEDSVEEAINEHVRNMEQGIVRMDSMINDLKLAAQVQEGRIDVALNHADVQDIAFFVTEEFRKQAEAQGITLKVDAPHPLPGRTDPLLLGDILRQLITNAINFTPRGGTVTVRARKAGHAVQLDIADTGAGIPKEDQKRLFGKFVRGSNAPRYKPDGNGLGLFIARGLTEALGGKMWLRSTLEKGTTVSFGVPLR